jgi:hypothetical protein
MECDVQGQGDAVQDRGECSPFQPLRRTCQMLPDAGCFHLQSSRSQSVECSTTSTSGENTEHT